MATAGWLLTESGRQPWIVQGLMLTKDGLSGSGSATQVGDQPGHRGACCTRTLGIIAAVLMVRHARRGLPDEIPTSRHRRRRGPADAGADLLTVTTSSSPS